MDKDVMVEVPLNHNIAAIGYAEIMLLLQLIKNAMISWVAALQEELDVQMPINHALILKELKLIAKSIQVYMQERKENVLEIPAIQQPVVAEIVNVLITLLPLLLLNAHNGERIAPICLLDVLIRQNHALNIQAINNSALNLLHQITPSNAGAMNSQILRSIAKNYHALMLKGQQMKNVLNLC